MYIKATNEFPWKIKPKIRQSNISLRRIPTRYNPCAHADTKPIQYAHTDKSTDMQVATRALECMTFNIQLGIKIWPNLTMRINVNISGFAAIRIRIHFHGILAEAMGFYIFAFLFFRTVFFRIGCQLISFACRCFCWFIFIRNSFEEIKMKFNICLSSLTNALVIWFGIVFNFIENRMRTAHRNK